MTAAEHNHPGEVLDAELMHELAVADRNPAPPVDIVDAEIVAPAPYRSPLDRDPHTGRYPTVLRGGVVSDPAVVADIAARARTRRPWWRRLTTPLPPGQA